MPEAEDVITDAARHATVFVQDLWRRHRPPDKGPRTIRLPDVARRLDLLVAAVFGTSLPIRPAQPPAPRTMLARIFKRNESPARREAVPATDGQTIWLPADSGLIDYEKAVERFRLLTLHQAMRAERGSVAVAEARVTPLVRDVALVLEAWAAEQELSRLLPGVATPLATLRRALAGERPDLSRFPKPLVPVEHFVREVMEDGVVEALRSPADSLALAAALAARLVPGDAKQLGDEPVLKDLWTGELVAPPEAARRLPGAASSDDRQQTSRSARLPRRPKVRHADEDEDDAQPGVWMVQTSQPHEHVEDPMGLQRPADTDEQTAAEEFADSFSELPQARLVSSPTRAKEVLLSDDPPGARTAHEPPPVSSTAEALRYPEWDYRVGAYREGAATVRLQTAPEGPQAWVDRTLAAHRPMLDAIRRQFEHLRGARVRLRKQLEGDDIDLAAWIDGQADLRAGQPLTQALYESHRPARQSLAIHLLIDVSGSTDSWISEHRRIIDVEREALLLVCLALEGLGEPYAVQAFSGEGPQAVTVRTVKRFDERYGGEVARRIAALEPEHYTRVGAAIRHATSLLMKQPAHHRLLLLLSDGKPNDLDEYEGRYGVEDVRQAVVEAKLQGLFPFCLTIDRQAGRYLPHIFGAGQYALLPKPDLLPVVLLEWMKRLVSM